MPQRNVWVRKDDLDKWNMVYTPDWLHAMINSEHGVVTSFEQKVDKVEQKIADEIVKENPNPFKIIKTPKQAKEIVENKEYISKSFSARKKK